MNVLSVDYTSPDAAQLFAKSLHETGFAVLKNHPISHHLIDDTFKDWKNFFSKPTEQKLQYKFDPKLQSGYFPFKTENAKGYTQKDLKEFYHLYVLFYCFLFRLLFLCRCLFLWIAYLYL